MLRNLDFRTYRTQVWQGAGLAAALSAILTLLPYEHMIEFAALLLAVIASIYIGFALADGRRHNVLVEIAGAVGFYGITLLGLWFSPYWLVLGLVLHGVYDMIHSPDGIQTTLTDWYPPFCAVVDWILGGYLLLLILMG